MTTLIWLRRNACLVLATIGVLLLDGAGILFDDGAALLRHYPADDAFYYLRLASSSPVPTFTTDIVTTGFHPLFWIVVTPVAKVFDGIAGVRGLLLVCLALHLAAGYLTVWILRRRHPEHPILAAVIGVVWLASPLTRSVSLSGVEAPLISLCLLALIAIVTVAQPERPRWWALLGAMVGLTYLARNDSVVVSGALVLGLLVTSRPARPVRTAATVAGCALAVALPWLAFLAAHDSFPRQDSARALALVFEERSAAAGLREVRITLTDNTIVLVGASDGDVGLRGVVERATGSRAARWAVTAVIGGAVVVIGALAALRLARTRRDAPLLGFVAGVVALYALYGLVLEVRPWYLAYWFVACVAVLLPEPLVEVVERARPWLASRGLLAGERGGWLAAGVAVLVTLALLNRTSPDWYPQEADKLLAAEAVVDRGIPAEEIASRNAGIYNWFVGAALLNVDGVVNPTVHDALRSRALCPYLREHGIEYLLDDSESIDRIMSSAPGAAIVRRERLSDEFPAGHEVVDVQELVRVELSC